MHTIQDISKKRALLLCPIYLQANNIGADDEKDVSNRVQWAHWK